MSQIVATIATVRTMRASRRRTRGTAGATVIDEAPGGARGTDPIGTAGVEAVSTYTDCQGAHFERVGAGNRSAATLMFVLVAHFTVCPVLRSRYVAVAVAGVHSRGAPTVRFFSVLRTEESRSPLRIRSSTTSSPTGSKCTCSVILSGIGIGVPSFGK